MDNDNLLTAILIISCVMLLIAVGMTWLEIMNYWKAPSGGVASARKAVQTARAPAHIDYGPASQVSESA